MQLMRPHPGLRTGGQGKVAGLWRNTEGKHACSRMRAAPLEDSNTYDSTPPVITSDSTTQTTLERVHELLEQWDAADAKLWAQAQETMVNCGFRRDLTHIYPLLVRTSLSTEAVRGINYLSHILGETTPLYFWVLQASTMLGWAYFALRGAGMLHVHVSAPAPTSSMTHKLRKMLPESNSDGYPACALQTDFISKLYQICAPQIEQLQGTLNATDREQKLIRAKKKQYVATALLWATYLCRILVEECMNPAPGALETAYLAQIAAVLVGMYLCHRTESEKP